MLKKTVTISVLLFAISTFFLNNMNSISIIANTYETDQIKSILSLCPKQLISQMVKDGWVIEMTENELYDTGEARQRLSAVTYEIEKRIVISEDIDRVLIHEIGHALNSYGWYSQTDEFHEIYLQEAFMSYLGTREETTYGITNENEYFASVFNIYVKDPDKCFKNEPRACHYIEGIVNNEFRELP